MSNTHNSFTDAEVRALFAAVRTPWWKAFLSMGVDVGLRPLEAINLLWRDIDPLTQGISIAPRPACEHRTHQGAVVPILACSPGRAAHRVVPVRPYTVNALRRLHRCLGDDSPYVFVSAESLCRLFPLLDAGCTPSTDILAPGLSRVFASVQRLARAELSRQQSRLLAETPWPRRTLAALRNTFADRAAHSMGPADLAAHLGLSHTSAILTPNGRRQHKEGQ